MRSLIWTLPAKEDYDKNLFYLLDQWDENVALEFIEKTESLLFLLKNGQTDFREIGNTKLREALICKQISLIYKINENNDIELIRFWNNYQDRTKLNP